MHEIEAYLQALSYGWSFRANLRLSVRLIVQGSQTLLLVFCLQWNAIKIIFVLSDLYACSCEIYNSLERACQGDSTGTNAKTKFAEESEL